MWERLRNWVKKSWAKFLIACAILGFIVDFPRLDKLGIAFSPANVDVSQLANPLINQLAQLRVYAAHGDLAGARERYGSQKADGE